MKCSHPMIQCNDNHNQNTVSMDELHFEMTRSYCTLALGRNFLQLTNTQTCAHTRQNPIQFLSK